MLDRFPACSAALEGAFPLSGLILRLVFLEKDELNGQLSGGRPHARSAMLLEMPDQVADTRQHIRARLT